MISVKYGEIPPHLQCGSFYESLEHAEVDEEISIPADCFSPEDNVVEYADFTRMIKTTAFWGLHCIPLSLIQYCSKNDDLCWNAYVREECAELDFAQDILEVFEDSLPLKRAIIIERDEIVGLLVNITGYSAEPAECAAARGRLDYLTLLHQYGHPWNGAASAAAAKEGHLNCLIFLHVSGCPWDERVHLSAGEHGHFDCVKYAFEHGLLWPDKEGDIYNTMCERIVRGNNMDMLQYALERELPLSAEAFVTAATLGQIDFIYTLLNANCPTDADATWYACQGGHFDILRVLHNFGVPFHHAVTDVAAEKGDLDILVYLHANGSGWNENTTLSAVREGQVNTLCYAIDNGCPFDNDILYHAVQCVSEGGLLCVRYLIEEAQLYDENCVVTILAAFTIGNHQALQYLLAHGPPYDQHYDDIEDDIMAEIYRNLQDNPICDDYDRNLLKCIECTTSYGWEINDPNSRFAAYIRENANCLPVCAAFFQTQLEK